MKFYFADNLDTVDPNFRVEEERTQTERNRQKEDIFAHELLNLPPYDGILLSRSIVGNSFYPGRYTQAQRLRLEREGVRKFFRFPRKNYSGDISKFPIMGDCGSFSYKNMETPPFGVEDTIHFYETCGFNYGVSPDHIILNKNEIWDDYHKRPDYISFRADYSLRNAKSFFHRCNHHRISFKPIGAVQFWSPRSAVKFSLELVDIGYDYIGLGGLAGRPTNEVFNIVSELRSKIPSTVKVHLFGFNRFDKLEDFNGLNINSFDSTSPLIKSFKDDKYNYFSPCGKHYLAIKVPSLKNQTISRKLQSGVLDLNKVSDLEDKCMKSLRAYNDRVISLEEALLNILNYENYITEGKNNSHKYKRTLKDRPWERCKCQICKNLGIDVLIFRGMNRNKRRGFHNLYVYYNKLKEVRNMESLKVPCIRVEQNPGRIIYSFAVNGKDIQKFASISRIKRDDKGDLLGYQRCEVLDHINDIRRYLDRNKSLLPNSIVIALNSTAKFNLNKKFNAFVSSGILELPLNDSRKIGWIVDGQQRVAALRNINKDNYYVSINAFESNGIDEEREQFILVNNTRPLPKSLIYELLPSMGDSIPPKLIKRKRAYVILEKLNQRQDSPFFFRIKTTTSKHMSNANIKDVSVLKMIENSMENGVLNELQFDKEVIYRILKNFWLAVQTFYKDAWSLPPKKSRLTHGAGIISMGFIMDTIGYKLKDEWKVPPMNIFVREIRKLGDDLPWIEGSWKFSKNLILPWDEVQNTNRHIDLVTNYLVRKYKGIN